MVAIPCSSPVSVERVDEDLINVTLQDDSITGSLGDPEMRSLCFTFIIHIYRVIFFTGTLLKILSASRYVSKF